MLIFWTELAIKFIYFQVLCKKMDQPVHVFQNTKLCSRKSDPWIFLLILIVKRPFHRKHFKQKIWGYWVNFKKMSYTSWTKRKSRSSHQLLSCNTPFFTTYLFYAKNHQKYQSRCLVHEFSFTDISTEFWS